MHTRGHCDGDGGDCGGGGSSDGWAVLRRGRWRKAIKRFCCGPRFFPSSALSSRLSTSPAHGLSPDASPAPALAALRRERALERKLGSLSPPLVESRDSRVVPIPTRTITRRVSLQARNTLTILVSEIPRRYPSSRGHYF
ncbi:hypothetical protein ALC53_01656 [Atta colombica]|uniref:Uncharacterized protein n=1 Tax=Atta colombica TaxID=520822 RepID=A0A195BTU5_9HYME|nr:hypothetical protein ALC53_01656 [Atta colombica]